MGSTVGAPVLRAKVSVLLGPEADPVVRYSVFAAEEVDDWAAPLAEATDVLDVEALLPVSELCDEEGLLEAGAPADL